MNKYNHFVFVDFIFECVFVNQFSLIFCWFFFAFGYLCRSIWIDFINKILKLEKMI